MKVKDIIWHFFLTTRPYSYAGEIARGIFFGLLLNPLACQQQYTIMVSSILTLLMWIYFNWQSDWIQKDEGRLPPSYWLCFSPIVFSAMLCIYYEQLTGVAGIGVYMCFILLYSQKKHHQYLGLLSPILRMATIYGHFFMLCMFFNITPNKEMLIIVSFIALLKGIRNFIGDIRDINKDKWEIPARYGIDISVIVYRVSFIVLIFISQAINNRDYSYVFMTLAIICWGTLEVIFKIFNGIKIHLFGYYGHQSLIVIISIFLSLLASSSIPSERSSLTLFSTLLILLASTQFLYKKNPGKNYN